MFNRWIILFLLASVSGAFGQSAMRTARLVNTSANTITLQPPSSVTNYSLTLPGAVSTTGSMLYTTNATGTFGWLTAASNGNFLQLVGGVPTWQDPVTVLQSNFVRYNALGPQNTATTTGGNFLFNTEYGTTNAAAAAGARINSVTTFANSNASALTLISAATGTGTAVGLNVSVSGGANQIAGLFNGGFVGIGVNPGFLFHISHTSAPSADAGYIMSLENLQFSPSAILAGSEIICKRTTANITATASIGNTTIRAADFICNLTAASTTATPAGSLLVGARGVTGNTSPTQNQAVGIGLEGYVQNVGPCTTASSISASSLFLGSTTQNYRGLHVQSPGVGVGTIVNGTGILIDPYTNGSGTNLAFFYNSSTSPVTITGTGHLGVGLNSTAPATTTDFDGAIVTRAPGTITVGAATNIAVGDRSYIRVNPTASVNVGLGVGTTAGQLLVVEVLSNGANTLTFLDNAAQNENLQGNFAVPATGGLLHLIWNGTLWMELSRSTP